MKEFEFDKLLSEEEKRLYCSPDSELPRLFYFIREKISELTRKHLELVDGNLVMGEDLLIKFSCTFGCDICDVSIVEKCFYDLEEAGIVFNIGYESFFSDSRLLSIRISQRLKLEKIFSEKKLEEIWKEKAQDLARQLPKVPAVPT